MKPRIFPNVGLAFTHDSKLAKLTHYVNWTILELSGGSDQWVHWPLRDSPSYQHAWPTLNVTLCLPIIVQLLQQLLWSFSFSLHCMSLGCPCCLRTALSTKWSVMNSCWIVFFFFYFIGLQIVFLSVASFSSTILRFKVVWLTHCVGTVLRSYQNTQCKKQYCQLLVTLLMWMRLYNRWINRIHLC